MAKKSKFYVVWNGNTPGIYTSWADCKAQVDGFTGARYKSYTSKAEAEAAYANGRDPNPSKSSKKGTTSKSSSAGIPVWESIAVDAACSGNPGLMEYQGVDTSTGKRLFHQGPFQRGTNNVGEFLALVHALAWLKQQGSTLPVYSDSRIAMGWVVKKKANTKLERHPNNTILFQMIERAEKWLRENTYSTKIMKWETKSWGEIPADFGRK